MDRTSAPADVTVTHASRMGRAIRQLRHSRKLTLVQLAALTKLSHSFLSQVERGLAHPSMSSLHRIAQALGTSQGRLIAGGHDDEPEAVAVLRRGEGVSIPMVDCGPGTTGSARQLVAGRGGFHPTEFVGLGQEFREFFTHDGNEFLYIAEGVIEVDLEHTTFVLEPGDSVRYPASQPHRWRAVGQAHTRMLMIHTDLTAHPVVP